jgi:hypothetical protein
MPPAAASNSQRRPSDAIFLRLEFDTGLAGQFSGQNINLFDFRRLGEQLFPA